MARGIMQAVRHIESMRRQAANERAHVQAEIERVRMEASIERVRLEASIERTRAFYIEMGNDRGPRKRDGDV